jgi:hypothetical protein
MKPLMRIYWLLTLVLWVAVLLGGAILCPLGLVVWIFTGRQWIDIWLDTFERLERHRDLIFEKTR